MNSKSQSQTLRTCGSCKRRLHTTYFGILRTSPDGYNFVCKDCRNFRRRRAYRSSENSDQIIWPLRDHNRNVLKSIQETNKTLKAFHLKTKNFAAVEIQVHSDYRRIEIQQIGEPIRIYIGPADDFSKSIEDLLWKLELRLLRDSDELSLSQFNI